jgi:hypothetical protein
MKASNINLTTVIRQSEDIDATDLNGDKVMMNLQKGKYFALNDVGSGIWDIISRPITVKDIIDTLLKEYEVDAAVCEETVMSFLEKLKDAELISIN